MSQHTPSEPITLDWHGLYGEKWGDSIVPESLAHPARFQPALIRRIYDFAVDQDMLKAGDRLVDPFGGTALGGREAIIRGMHWEGMEIERHFHDVGAGCDCTGISLDDYERFNGQWRSARYLDGRHWCPACIAAAEAAAADKKKGKGGVQVALFGDDLPAGCSAPHRYRGNIGFWSGLGPGTARLHLGDSRNLLFLLGEGWAGAVTSPPYGQSLSRGEGPGARYDFKTHSPGNAIVQTSDPDYGRNGDNLGNQPATDDGFAASLSSPPYERSIAQHPSANDPERRRERMEAAGIDLSVSSNFGGPNSTYTQGQTYSSSPENLGNQAGTEDGFAASLASPPYGGLSDKHDRTGHEREVRRLERVNPERVGDFKTIFKNDGAYGDSAQNLGNQPATDEGFDVALSSPPYAGTRIDGAGDEGNSGLRMPDGSYPRGTDGWELRKGIGGRYGNSSGQLAGMPDEGFDAALASPPYGDSSVPPVSVQGYQAGELKMNEGQTYGNNDGNLGAMTSGDFDAAMSSPPYAQTRINETGGNDLANMRRSHHTGTYGSTDGNLGAQARQDFWLSARQIVDQTFAILRPGGVAIWVVKDYVRDHRVIPFCDQWRRLCEAAGFRTTYKIRAWQVEAKGAQYNLEGDLIQQEVHRKGFFRRLHEKNYPHLAIDYEIIWVMQKPN